VRERLKKDGRTMSNSASRIRTASQRALAKHASEIRTLNRRTIGDIIETGKHLIAAKKLVGHGGWLAWIDREFGWSDRTARRYIEFAEAVGKSANLADLNVPISGLFLLAAEDTPTEVIRAIAERCEAGERLSLAEVKQMIAEAEAIDDEDVDDGLATRMPLSASDVEHAYRSRYGIERKVEEPPVRHIRHQVTYERETVAAPYYVHYEPCDPPARRTIEDLQRDRNRGRAEALARYLDWIERHLDEDGAGAAIEALTDEERDQAHRVVDKLRAALGGDEMDVEVPDQLN
jgi:Protein of unknown function (DUF3102)